MTHSHRSFAHRPTSFLSRSGASICLLLLFSSHVECDTPIRLNFTNEGVLSHGSPDPYWMRSRQDRLDEVSSQQEHIFPYLKGLPYDDPSYGQERHPFTPALEERKKVSRRTGVHNDTVLNRIKQIVSSSHDKVYYEPGTKSYYERSSKFDNEPSSKYPNVPSSIYHNEPSSRSYIETNSKSYNEPSTMFHNEPNSRSYTEHRSKSYDNSNTYNKPNNRHRKNSSSRHHNEPFGRFPPKTKGRSHREHGVSRFESELGSDGSMARTHFVDGMRSGRRRNKDSTRTGLRRQASKADDLPLSWNANFKTSSERLSPRRRNANLSNQRSFGNAGVARNLDMDTPSSAKYNNDRVHDSRIRSNRRQILDKSYFLPTYNKPLSGDFSKEESTASASSFQVPPIHKIPEPSSLKKKRPNIILMMTDDLDVELGSLNYMPRLLHLMGEGGALFPNAYTTTPMCCPSRSSMLTGMYIHNHQVFTNHQNCSSPLWQNTHERRSFASYLSKAGYRTGYFGKYLNRYNGSHVPEGWQDWGALLMNSRYYNYTINRNNQHVKYGNRYPRDYYPHVITNDGTRFLKSSEGASDPFLLVLSYPAPHGPEDSAPEHAHKYFNASDHHTASYNYAPNPDKQWMLQFTDRMPDIQLKYTDLLMTKRLQTLQTIDAAVEKIVKNLEEIGEANNTYLFFTSDHGYHLGQFGLAKGKSMPFEFDIKVPFLVRGPGIKAGVDLPQIALNVDLAPTFLDIAGLPRPPQMDGRSLLPVLQSSAAPDDAQQLPWRDSFLVESSGRLREEEELEKKEQRTWERERALIQTLLKATEGMDPGAEDPFSARGHAGASLYTSKHERLEEVCQRGEFSSPCQHTQKWHCVKIGFRWKIKKCRHKSMAAWQKHCICHFMQGFGTYRKLDVREKRKQRNFLKKYVTKDFHSFDSKFIRSFNNINIPLHFNVRNPPAPTSPRGGKQRKRNGRNRNRRSLPESPLSNETGSTHFPLDLNFENYSRHFELDSTHDAILDYDDVDDDVDDDDDEAEEESVSSPPFDLFEEGDLGEGSDLGGDRGAYPPSFNFDKTLTDQAVHDFVEEKEIRDLEDHIHDIAGEIHSLQNASVPLTEPTDANNLSATPGDTSHGCHANEGQIDCQEEVYANISAWRNSKVALEDHMRRLRQQLHVMKNIMRHLQSKKPDLFDRYGAEEYDQFGEGHLGEREEEEKEEDFYGYGDRESDYQVPTDVEGGKGVVEPLLHSMVEDKQLTLPEVGLDLPLEEDVNSPAPKSDRRRPPSRRPPTPPAPRKSPNPKDYYFDTDYDAPGYDRGKLYYPISLPPLPEEEGGSDSLQNRFCWCDRRVIQKLSVQETRERKREERQKVKEKRQRKKLRRKGKGDTTACNYSTLNCKTHDNEHWRTPPLWTDGQFCFCINSANNTYWCLRTINQTHNFLYCEFITGLITYYDLHIDPYQLRNVAFTLSNERVLELNSQLTLLRSCKGADECDRWAFRQKSVDDTQTETPRNTSSQNYNVDSPSPNLGQRLDHLSLKLSLKKKKIKKLQERQRRKRLRKQNKRIQMLIDAGYLPSITNPSLIETEDLKQSIRLPRKSRHDKAGRRQRRKEKKRRKKRKEKRVAKGRRKKKQAKGNRREHTYT